MSAEEINQQNPAVEGGTGGSEEVAERIKKAALQGNFNEAEKLRDELMRVDPMNLKLIVSTGEAIEAQKTRLLDKDHLAVWQELYQELTDEETNGLFYSMEPAEIETNKLLQVQGKVSNRLFFIDSGKVVLFYRKDGKNMVAAQLGRGDIVGETSFFEISLCPLSAATQSEVKLYSLTRNSVEKWQETYPGLYEKLAEICRARGKSTAAIISNNLDRRSTPRYQGSGMVSAVVLDKAGNPGDNRFKGALSDVSPTGLCFDIKCSKQETARVLLATTIDLNLVFDGHEDAGLNIQGQVTKVSFHLHNDYSVHVKYSEPIDEETFNNLPCRRPQVD